MLNYILSFFKNTFDTVGEKTTLEKELNDIKNGTYQLNILKCRDSLIKNNNKDLYNKLKSKLKAVTFCGFFEGGRKLSNLAHYNNLIVIDIDNLENIEDIKSRLMTDQYILSVWLSPSSLGLKGLVKINSTIDNHKDFFYSLSIYFLNTYGVELDKSGSDITRLCYVSWDPDMYINYDSKIYDHLIHFSDVAPANKKPSNEHKIIAPPKNAFATEGLNKQIDRQIIKKIITFLNNKNSSITYDFASWVKVAVIIANSFSYDLGENYFLNLCQIDGDKHNEIKSKELLKYCYANRNLSRTNKLSFATLIFFAKEKGFVKK